jgi:TolB protein
MKTRFRTVSMMAFTMLIVCSLPATAQATTPGANGRIAFRRYLDAGQTQGALFTIDPDGTDEFQVTHPPAGEIDTEPDWSPDGTVIAFEHHDLDGCGNDCETIELWVVNADGTDAHAVVPCSGDDSCLFIESPAWSPDGTRIAFALALGPIVNDTADVGIWTVHPDGSHLARVTKPPTNTEDHSAQWSPNGTTLVIERIAAAHDWGSALFTVRSDGSMARRITPWSLNAGDHPDWSPDGRWIVFRTFPADGSSRIYIEHPDGSRRTLLLYGDPDGVTYYSSSWSPDGTSITIAVSPGTGPDGSPDVWTVRVRKGKAVSWWPVTRTDSWDSAADWGTAAST